MARSLIIPNPGNATIEDLKLVSRVGSSETATRCTAIQMLLAGATRELVCQALLVTNRALRKWINCFNHSGIDGLIAKKRPGRMAIMIMERFSQKIYWNSKSPLSTPGFFYLTLLALLRIYNVISMLLSRRFCRIFDT